MLGTDGTGAHTLFARRPLNDIPFVTQDDPQSIDHFPDVGRPGVLYMDGREVYKFAVGAMNHALRAACDKFGITPADLDLIIPHQANLRIIQSAARELGAAAGAVLCQHRPLRQHFLRLHPGGAGGTG